KLALAKHEAVRAEYEVIVRGKLFWLDITVSPMQDDDVIWIARDVTERKHAEDALRASEKRFRALIDNSSDAVMLVGLDARPFYQSPSAERILGFTLEDRNERPTFSTVHPNDVEAMKAAFAQIIENPSDRL